MKSILKSGTSWAGAAVALLVAPSAAQWTNEGVRLHYADGGSFHARIVPHPAGGYSLGFLGRLGGTQTYAILERSHVSAAGESLITESISDDNPTDFAADGRGGFHCASVEFGSPRLVTLTCAPRPSGWPASVTLGSSSTSILALRCATTSTRGCIVAWTGVNGLTVKGVDSTGVIPAGWPPGGKFLGAVEYQDAARVIGDASGGAWVLRYNPSQQFVLVRLSAGGVTVAGPIVLAEGPIASPLCDPLLLPGGDLLVAWKEGGASWFGDPATVFEPGAFRLQRIRPDGTLATGWPVGGLAVRAADDSVEAPVLIPDSADGAYLGWGTTLDDAKDLRVCHFLGNGSVAAGWDASGSVLTMPNQVPRMSADQGGITTGDRVLWTWFAAPDGAGGVFIAYDVGATIVRLVHRAADATPGEGWPVDGVQVHGTMEIGSVFGLAADGHGNALVAWNRIDPTQYYLEASTARLTRVLPPGLVGRPPLPARPFSLSVVGGNPLRGVPVFDVVLEGAAPARLEIVDVEGRRIASRDVPSTGRVALGSRLPPGIYFAKLRQGPLASTSRRFVTLR